MDITNIIKFLILITGVFLILVILLQNRSGGLGTVFGGSGGGEYYRSKRGLEAFLFNSTIFLGISFVILSIALAILNA